MISRRLQVFISSRMEELAPERHIVKIALDDLEVNAWIFEKDAGARPHSIQKTYLEEVETSDIYVGIFWKGYGKYTIDEFRHAQKLYKPCLIYEKSEALEERDPQLQEFLDEVNKVETGLTVRWFDTPDQLGIIIKQDIAAWLVNKARKPGFVHGQSNHQLPPAPVDFTGREAEIEKLNNAVQKGRITISGLRGMGGIGKTTLALKLANMLIDEYPDGQIFLDLKGTSKTPLSSNDALTHVVRSFLPDEELPDEQSELEGLYRSVLHGKKAIILMDNASSATQVAPLIPPDGNLLIVTSRQHFRLSGSISLDLEKLPSSEAIDLLDTISPRSSSQADAIVHYCDYLPLAIRLAGSALAERVDITPEDYVQRLESKRL
jgi:hypothetical protein